ncbi:HAE1 family hydrophobic/amphiphilic exporter-1 [Ancylomarina subtilis]|uniref:HAE1 family hydrophobic/amphiphilic exporter-1 n=1 Tax=Ancylomarina subtilis TaxID=1639035 RepID=A0A4Q7VCD3_9BACT|nr:efflux RND transporter permease subunit [Ancylomarina subtilis]RZT92388.1 HAE1 family hydrophobic/amphiphilic exporter-1 [Ancylomarina subtilis]
MKKITQFSVNYPVTVSMIIMAILLLGYVSLGKLNVDLFPEMNAPRIFVEIKAGERPPEEIEKQFIEAIEAQAIRQKGVSQVSSVCMVGSARLTVEYTWGSDMDEALLDLQKTLSSYSQNSDIDEFTITQHDPNASPILIVGMLHPEIQDMNELRKVGENYIRNELIRLDGIAEVELTGAQEKEVRIETNQYLLDAHNITIDQIVQKIQSLNQNLSGGSIVEMGTKYIIKGAGLIRNINEIENVIVGTKTDSPPSNTEKQALIKGKVPILLKDIAKVSFVAKKAQNIVRINGIRCIGLSIYKETGSNTVQAVEDFEKTMVSIKKALPGYQFITVQNQGQFIQKAIDEVEETALLGVLIAILVLFVFLRRIKVTAIVSFAIPVSIIATFNLMYFNGLSLNIMTLGGLALGAGMLVDNAIVVIENIFRKMELGLSVKDAAIEGTSEVGGAIVASTLTTIVVFLPIVYMHGASGALFKDQAWTVAFSLIASLFVAILMIPMLFHYAYKGKRKNIKFKSVKIGWYGVLLKKLLSKRVLIIGGATILLIITGLILPYVGNEYLPKAGIGEFSLNIELKEGTQLERTSQTVIAIESMLNQSMGEQFETIYSQIGPGSSSSTDKSVFQNENTANIKIRLKSEYLAQSESILNHVSTLIAGIPNAEITIVRDETALQSTIGTENAPIEVEVKGKDMEILERLSNVVKDRLNQVPDLTNIKTNIEEGAPEVDVVIDRYKAGIFNLSTEAITNQLQDILMGKSAGKFEKGGEMNDINIQLPEHSLSELNTIGIKSGNAEIPLYELAHIKKSSSPKQMLRRNQTRIGKISADIQGSEAFDQVIDKINSKLKGIDLPQGYQVNLIGEEQKRQEALSNLSFALMLSIILVYMVMASQFESLIHPFTILLTIPLAGVGAVWAFFLLGIPMNIMAYIGIIMLGGIAVNDSIILVDAINQFKQQGEPLINSIVMAGENRIRPIIMTSITTILALLPLTIGFGESAALRAPMAIAVIAGLITSTLLTLVVIPCVYYVFDRIQNYFSRSVNAE